jgi:cell wall-associated NlpC family hydrolase
MKKPALAIVAVCVLTLGLMVAPVRSILAEPVVKVISNPAQYLNDLSSNLSGKKVTKVNNKVRTNWSSEANNLPRVTFPDGKSVRIQRYVESPKNTSAANNSSRVRNTGVVAPKTKTQDTNNSGVQITYPDGVTHVEKPAVVPETSKPEPKKVEPKPVSPKNDAVKKVVADSRPDLPAVEAFREIYNDSPAHALVARAIWYMKYGYMVYGHQKYWDTGYIDCSNFVSLVYKDFGYNITSAARKYNTVGTAVSGVYAKRQPGSSKKYMLAGTEKLKPGDIITFWKEDSNGKRYIGHVAIYMGKLNGKPTIIHTVKGYPTAIGTTDSFTYWYGEHFNGVRRVLSSSAYSPKTKYSDNGPVIPAKYQMKTGPVIMPAKLPGGF